MERPGTFWNSVELWVSIYFVIMVTRSYIMHVTARGRKRIGRFGQPQVAILKNGCHGHQGASL